MKKVNVVVTGGSGDIAKAISDVLSNDKYTVHLPGKEVLDVTSTTSVNSYFLNQEVDILINNAGYIVPATLHSKNLEDDLRTVDINLSGIFRCSSVAHSRNQDLKIINIGSSAGTKPRGSWGSYCATKAALIMLTKCWSMEGIDVICISPGRTATKMRTELFGKEDNNTLLSASDFSKAVKLAIENKMPWGENIDVTVDNLENICEKYN